MSTHKQIEKICCGIMVLMLVLTVLFMNAQKFGIQAVQAAAGYETRLFDTERVHVINIVMDDWDGFLETCEQEEYTPCSVIIDNEAFKNIAIRAKGNTSLSQVSSYGNNRYSFKIEFDHYENGKSYYGLDKLSLNNIIQDNTYMKDYLTYQMMGDFGVSAPLCSFAQIQINGEDWGLYLAVEGVEDSFLERNYESEGELYKPDSMDMGAGPGNGRDFSMEEGENGQKSDVSGELPQMPDGQSGMPQMPDGQSGMPQRPDGQSGMPQRPDGQNGMMQMPDGQNGMMQMPDGQNGMMQRQERTDGKMGRASSDVSLIYSDDAIDSYQNIFNNAKTDLTDADKERLIASIKKLNECEEIESVVNVDKVIRYFAVHNFVCNFDSYTGSMIHNYYLYEKDGQMEMIPWDYNLAFGGFENSSDASAMVNYPIDSPVSGGTIESRPMLAWIFNDEAYLEQYHQYLNEFVSHYLENDTLVQMIEDTKNLIAPYVENDPTAFCSYEEFVKGADTLKEFCSLRLLSIQGQLNGTIGATSEAQSEDSSTRIDASGLNLSDMGAMHMGNAGRGGFNRGQDNTTFQKVSPASDA